MKKLLTLLLLFFVFFQSRSQDAGPDLFSGLKFRSIGPALTSGRISDFAVVPGDRCTYYVASASGGVWKTTNCGNTYTPIFDKEGSYSIGCISLDPQNKNTVWVGTGENNNQRSVSYGDGVYRSDDGGKSWKNMGLKRSEHISRVIVHPNNSNVVFVAAYGPLWSAGGDRGVYKSTDGGKTWEKSLFISENTGIADLVMDPRDPNVLYAAAHQRRRHVFTYLGGGPESAIYKTTNGGITWEKLTNGLPAVDKGRIGLAIPPANPDIVYAIIETSGDEGGFFRSTDRGASFEKRSGMQTSGNYYQEIIPGPKDENVVYVMDTWGKVTRDGGKTFESIGNKHRHVDDHAIWLDPADDDYILIGCDGGIYESFDNGQNWNFKANLPVTQFYRVEVDNDTPFYNVYGGTQDNFTLGGPSRTKNMNGIVNSDWFITKGGDGFETQVDPEDPNIVYSQSQYGWLVRYDKKSGEKVGIRPFPEKGEEAHRWNWDAPLIISPHNHKRLYFAAQKVFKSDDRGDSWEVISPDLSSGTDRNKLPVMGKVWGVDAVAKNKSTSIYGNIVTLSESPKKEGLLYAGTDDGLIRVTKDGGKTWEKLDKFPGVPGRTYVNAVVASRYNENNVYAVFNNHKNGDFSPYILKSSDKGGKWKSISGNLPSGAVYSLVEDPVKEGMLFAGTEFGVYFTPDDGGKWYRLKGGLPTIAVRDMEIQEREDDLVLATFGRGFYILDDISPLRDFKETVAEKEAVLFSIVPPLMFIESSPLGLRGKSFQGESYFSAENPPVGAAITYYLKDPVKTFKEERIEREKDLEKKGEIVGYPDYDQLKMEDLEEKSFLVFSIRDANGELIRRMTAKPAKGINRIYWNFRYPTTSPVSLKEQDLSNPFADADVGILVLPGKYSVTMEKFHRGEISVLAGPEEFTVKAINLNSLAPSDRAEAMTFFNKVGDLRKVAHGVAGYRRELESRVNYLKKAVIVTPGADLEIYSKLREIEKDLYDVRISLHGDPTLGSREFETLPGILDKIEMIVYNLWQTTAPPTGTSRKAYELAGEELKPVIEKLRTLTAEIDEIGKKLQESGAPWVPGVLPEWE